MSDKPHYAEFAPEYKKLPTAAYVIAYLNIVFIILMMIIVFFGSLFSGSVPTFLFGLISVALMYLNYRVTTGALDCDSQMLGGHPKFPIINGF